MKKYFLILASLMILVTAEKYSRKYDDVDVDKILQSNRILNNYIRCLLDEGPCTAEGRELRSTYTLKKEMLTKSVQLIIILLIE